MPTSAQDPRDAAAKALTDLLVNIDRDKVPQEGVVLGLGDGQVQAFVVISRHTGRPMSPTLSGRVETIAAPPTPVATMSAPVVALDDDDREILVAIGQDVLRAKEVASRIGEEEGSTLRDRLSSLRKRRLLDHNGRGYYVTDIGRRAIEPSR